MSETITLVIDGRVVSAQVGEKILPVALRHGIYIPHLCYWPELSHPFGACRLCLVEIEGRPQPVTSCTESVQNGMVVRTRSERLDRLVATAFQLLMSRHRLECSRCRRNRNCALQQIAQKRSWRLKPKDLPLLPCDLPVDESAPDFTYDPNKCVLCGRCVWVCRQLGKGILGFAQRGLERRVTTFGGQPLANFDCRECLNCVCACPVGALTFKDSNRTCS